MAKHNVWGYVVLVAAIILSLSFSNSFRGEQKHVGRSVGLDNRQNHSLLTLREEGEDQEEDEEGSGLSPCLKRCDGRLTENGQTKRSIHSPYRGTFSSRSSICGSKNGRGSKCTERGNNLTDIHERGLWKRAPPKIPSGEDDLRRKTQKELAKWIIDIIEGGTVKMLWSQDDDKEHIELESLIETDEVYMIPTSFFLTPGDEQLAYGTKGLVGCTAMTAVKVPTPEDGKSGVYLGHYWETPGWDTDINGDGVKIMNAQTASYITDFLKKGFPQTGMRRRTPADRRDPKYAEPNRQESMDAHKADLQGAEVHIMHPIVTEEDPPDSNKYVVPSQQPQFKKTLDKMRATIEGIVNKDPAPDFLYVPDRADERWQTTESGRSIFLYDPNFEGHKAGVVLFEDGGKKEDEEKDENGFYKPGPGGPFFFDFGPASEEVEMTDAPPRAKL